MIPDRSKYMYILVTDFVCPQGRVCEQYPDLESCNKSLEWAKCIIYDACVVSKECITSASKLIGLADHGMGHMIPTGENLDGPSRAVSVIHYLSVSDRLSGTVNSIASALPGALTEFYKNNAGVINVVAAAALGYAASCAVSTLLHRPKQETQLNSKGSVKN